ncbi:MAG: hypothetical protein ABJM58_04570 [Alteripontixanthobacter sp.]
MIRFTGILFGLISVGCNESKASYEAELDLDDYVQSDLEIASFRSAEVDLNGSGGTEIVIYATDQKWCGSGGCTLFILERTSEGYRSVGRTTITNLPIEVMDNSHHGWRDLAVTVRGGGAMPPYVAVLPFDGKTYAANPSMPPAIRSEAVNGTVLISD